MDVFRSIRKGELFSCRDQNLFSQGLRDPFSRGWGLAGVQAPRPLTTRHGGRLASLGNFERHKREFVWSYGLTQSCICQANSRFAGCRENPPVN